MPSVDAKAPELRAARHEECDEIKVKMLPGDPSPGRLAGDAAVTSSTSSSCCRLGYQS